MLFCLPNQSKLWHRQLWNEVRIKRKFWFNNDISRKELIRIGKNRFDSSYLTYANTVYLMLKTKQKHDNDTAPLSDTPRSNSRGWKQGVKEKLGGIGRVLEKYLWFMRGQSTLRFFVLFPRVLVGISLLISKFLCVPNPFYEVLDKFSRVFPRCWIFFQGVRWGFSNHSGCWTRPDF